MDNNFSLDIRSCQINDLKDLYKHSFSDARIERIHHSQSGFYISLNTKTASSTLSNKNIKNIPLQNSVHSIDDENSISINPNFIKFRKEKG